MYKHKNRSAPSFQSHKDSDREPQKYDSERFSPEERIQLNSYPRNKYEEIIKDKPPIQKSIWDDIDFSSESEGEEDKRSIENYKKVDEEKIENWRNDPALPRNGDFEKYVADSAVGMKKYTESPNYDPEKLKLLYEYTGPGYMINASIREAERERDLETAANLAKPYVEAIDSLLGEEKLRVEQNPVYRGRKRHTDYEEGRVVSDPAPQSASVSPAAASGYAHSLSMNPDRQGIELFIFNAISLNVSAASIIGQKLFGDSRDANTEDNLDHSYAVKEAEALIRPGEKFLVELKARDPSTGKHKAILVKEEEPKQQKQEGAKVKRRLSLG